MDRNKSLRGWWAGAREQRIIVVVAVYVCVERTDLLQLLNNLIMLPPQLRPLRKLILTARSIHLRAQLQELRLQDALFRCRFRGGGR